VLLHSAFGDLFPNGVLIGDINGFYFLFTSADAVTAFLPSGGTPSALTSSATNPDRSHDSMVLAAQILALTLNIATNDGIGNLVISGTGTLLDGMIVNQLLALANTVLGGGPLPGGLTYSGLNDVITAINESSFSVSGQTMAINVTVNTTGTTTTTTESGDSDKTTGGGGNDKKPQSSQVLGTTSTAPTTTVDSSPKKGFYERSVWYSGGSASSGGGAPGLQEKPSKGNGQPGAGPPAGAGHQGVGPPSGAGRPGGPPPGLTPGGGPPPGVGRPGGPPPGVPPVSPPGLRPA